MDRGKVLWEKDLEELKGNWGRYRDKDGDGITYRTIPGNKHPTSAYFTRGSGHDEYARYTEDSEVYMRNMERLKKKIESAKNFMPKSVLREVKGAEVGIFAFGSTENAILEAQHLLEKAHGIKSDFLRLRAIPFTDEVTQFIEKHNQIMVVEQNRDGQMYKILLAEYPQFAMKFKSVAFHDGLPASAIWVRDGILEKYSVNSNQKKAVAKKNVNGAKPSSLKKAAKKSAVKK
jgi:2-oxoglutarate ferredoxin oxidoreductase subunit alpha